MNRRAVMGWQLVREAEDHAPANLTWRERFALSVLANAAMDATRECPHGIEDNPDIVRRLRLSRSARYEVLAALCDKGALIQVERGRNGVRAVYAVAPFTTLAQLKGLENPDASTNGHGFKHPENPDPSTVDNSTKRPGFRDASANGRAAKGPGFTTEGSGKPGLKGPGNPDSIGDDGDLDETRTTHARACEAILAAVPDATSDEMDEAIRLIKVKFHPRNLVKYVQTLIERGDLLSFFPCGYGEDRKHSERCRNRDCEHCTTSWCEGRCHSRPAKGAKSA
jgi:hypothetical protein